MAIGDRYKVAADALNLREGPSTTARVITVLTRDDVVVIDGQDSADWWRITVADGRCGPGFVAARHLVPESAPPPPSFIVLTLAEGTDPAAVDDAIRRMVDDPQQAGTTLTPLGNRRYALARAAQKTLLARLNPTTGRAVLVEWLMAIPGIAAAEPIAGDVLRAEYAARPIDALPAPAAPIAGPPGGISWNVAMVRAPEAWDLLGGVAARPWQTIRVGHIDTGYTLHPVLGFENGVSPFDRVQDGINYREGGLPLDPLDYVGQPGHGTRTSSVLCGNAPQTLLGVAPGVTVVPYRITDCVVIDTIVTHTRFAEAIRHAVVHAACDVLSVSLGDPCFPPRAVGEAVDAAYEAGVILVAAAGNLTSEVTFPGRYSRAITAGGVTAERKPWTGASRGARVDICAPAENVVRANTRRVNGAMLFELLDKEGDGTSYATVHVAGAAALWLAHHGAALRPLRGTWQLVESFRACLRAGAVTPPMAWPSSGWGAGILDIVRLLQAPLPDPASLRQAAPARDENQ